MKKAASQVGGGLGGYWPWRLLALAAIGLGGYWPWRLLAFQFVANGYELWEMAAFGCLLWLAAFHCWPRPMAEGWQ